MSANDSRNKNVSTSLNDFLDFGPDQTVTMAKSNAPTNEVWARIQQLVKTIQEINQRMDRLSSLF